MSNLFSNKKAEQGISTLIIFISSIVVAAIAAGVLMQTATSLQNKALLTGERAKDQVSTGIEPVIVYAEDGTDGILDAFFMKIKLSPGSDSIKFRNMLIGIDTATSSEDAIFGERVLTLDSTPKSFDLTKVDLNRDGTADSFWLASAALNIVTFNISDGPYRNNLVNVTLTTSDGRNISEATVADPVQFVTYNTPFELNNEQMGTIAVVGTTESNTTIDSNALIVVGHGAGYEQGAYAVDYLLKSNTWKDGYMQRGDVMKVAFAVPSGVVEDETVIIRLIPKTGGKKEISIVIPDLINRKRVYMFS